MFPCFGFVYGLWWLLPVIMVVVMMALCFFVLGNPCDDWNWMEELNKYMEIPPNHPGALAEVRHENDRYEVVVTESCGNEARAVLVNKEEGGQVSGLEKSLRLHRDKNEIEVAYQLPRDLPYLSVECGLSPDYFHLVRSEGNRSSEGRHFRGQVGAGGYSMEAPWALPVGLHQS